MNVLWGRVVVLGVVLLLVFLLGRSTGGSRSELQALQDRVEAQNAEIDQLEAENRALASPSPDAAGDPNAPGTVPTATPTSTASPTPSPTSRATATPTAGSTAAQNYTVRPGDSLRGIANRFYGNAVYAKCIQNANNIDDARSLPVGKSLTIPPKPAQPCT